MLEIHLGSHILDQTQVQISIHHPNNTNKDKLNLVTKFKIH